MLLSKMWIFIISWKYGFFKIWQNHIFTKMMKTDIPWNFTITVKYGSSKNVILLNFGKYHFHKRYKKYILKFDNVNIFLLLWNKVSSVYSPLYIAYVVQLRICCKIYWPYYFYLQASIIDKIFSQTYVLMFI